MMGSRQRRQLPLLMFLMISSALFQVGGLGSLIPFIKLLQNPAHYETLPSVQIALEVFGFNQASDLIVPLGVCVAFLFVAGNLMAVFTLWFSARFTWRFHADLSQQLIETYCDKPYEFYFRRSASEIGKNVLLEAGQLAAGALAPLLQAVVSLSTVLFVALFLVAIDPKLTLLTMVVFTAIYILLYQVVTRPLSNIGEERVAVDTARYQIVEETLGSFKELKISGKAGVMLTEFRNAALRFSRLIEYQTILGQSPRYGIESVAIVSIIVLVLYTSLVTKSLNESLPLLSAFAVAGYRILPGLQAVYHGLSTFRVNEHIVNRIALDLKPSDLDLGNQDSPELSNSIVLTDLKLGYAPNEPVLEIDNLVLPAETSIAIVGGTGSGKSTLMDALLGLIKPMSGKILVDGVELSAPNVSAWQRTLGYVPQNVFIVDASIAQNVALGESAKGIDFKRVKRVAQLAQMDDMISSTSDLYTSVGRQGSLLSGGQKQRIGIARALYDDKSVLFFDEATSALDPTTEYNLLVQLLEQKGKTLFFVTHSVEVMKLCERVLYIHDGKCSGFGSFEELTNKSPEFVSFVREEVANGKPPEDQV